VGVTTIDHPTGRSVTSPPAGHVIDIDPDLLRRAAGASLHAAEQAAVHMAGEMACLDASGVPALLETLTPHGPWAWAIMPAIREDGGVQIPIATTLEQIAEWYRFTRTRSNVLGFEPLVEVRGSWYTFQEGMSIGWVPATAQRGETETIALFPVTTSTGITGELAWWRMDRAALDPSAADAPVLSELEQRRDLLARHDRLLAAFGAADIDGILAVTSEKVQSAVRDYVDDTGTLVGLDGPAEHRQHYGALFERYAVERVDLLARVVQPWYVFAETRWTVRPRTGDAAGSPIAFHTAEFLIPAADGRFIARVGHGTDPATIGEVAGEEPGTRQ
jgi:hypothetical protein